MTLRGYKINTISHSDATRESLTGNHQARKSQQQMTKTCQVQLHTILLPVVSLLLVGLLSLVCNSEAQTLQVSHCFNQPW